MIVFKDLTAITKIWESFSSLFTTPDMAWYIYWGILIVATFVLPILVAAIITIIVYLAYNPNTYINDEGTEAEKAKSLHEAATKVEAGNKDSDYFFVFPIIFIALIIAFLIYAFLVVKIGFSVGMIIGIVVVAAILYYIYMLIFAGFSIVLSYFYGNKSYGNLNTPTDIYWLKVDPE